MHAVFIYQGEKIFMLCIHRNASSIDSGIIVFLPCGVEVYIQTESAAYVTIIQRFIFILFPNLFLLYLYKIPLGNKNNSDLGGKKTTIDEGAFFMSG